MTTFQHVDSYTSPPALIDGAVGAADASLTVQANPPGVNVSGDPFPIYVVAPDGTGGELMLVTPTLTGTGNKTWPITRGYGASNPNPFGVTHAHNDLIYLVTTGEMLEALSAWANLTGKPSTFAPSAHHANHEPGGSDPMAVNAAAGTGSLRTLGAGATQAAAGNDSRLSDARTPTGHHASHEHGGSDELPIESLPTAENDPTLVFAPDGAGGVIARAETGGGSGITHYAVVMTGASPPAPMQNDDGTGWVWGVVEN